MAIDCFNQNYNGMLALSDYGGRGQAILSPAQMHCGSLYLLPVPPTPMLSTQVDSSKHLLLAYPIHTHIKFLGKSAYYQKYNFLISEPKHMLLVLQKDSSFEHQPINNNIFTIVCLKCGLSITILKPTANRSPYIFTLVQKVKHSLYKIHVF